MSGDGESRKADLWGVVLAGGKSSRMGQDKARLRLKPGEPTLLERAIALLSACVGEVGVSCAHGGLSRLTAGHDPGEKKRWRLVEDSRPDFGPVAALEAVLRADNRAVLLLPCDLPFMRIETLRRLLEARRQAPEGTLLTAFGEKDAIQPLVAVYEPGCRELFTAALERGERRLRLIVPEDRRLLVPYGSEEARCFFNLNSPAELAAAMAEGSMTEG